MKINRVILENYRVHKKREFEFTKGINLVLGKNGAGKSSILEAIGLTLFGAETRTSDKDAVMIGEKTAFISVEITGNDGIDYIVEKKFGSSNDYRLFPKDGKIPLIQGKDAILAKIKEISGIERNLKEIYQNVVTAYQNKIVGIFTDTPKNRENLFNKIFDTAIYREMETGYLKNAKGTYELQAKLLLKEIEQKREGLENIESLNKEIVDLENKLLEVNSIYLKRQIEIKEKEKEKEELFNLKNKIELLNKEITGNKLLIEESKSLFLKEENELKLSEQAMELCKLSESDYNLYIEMEEQSKVLSEIIKKQEDIKNKIEIAKEKKQESEKNMEKFKIIIFERNNNINELIKRISDLNDKKIVILDENAKEIGRKRELDIKKEDLEKKIVNIKEILLKIEEIDRAVDNIDIEKKLLLEKSSKHEEYINTNIILNLEKENFLNRLEIKKGKDKSANEIIVKIEELKEAKNKLAGGLCPYLHEKCKNIGEDTDFREYLKKRENDLLSELNFIKSEMNLEENIEEELNNILKKIAVVQKEISEIEIIFEKIKRLEVEKELNLLKRKELTKEFILYENKIDSKESIKELIEEINKEREKLLTEVEKIQAFINENGKKQSEIEIEIKEIKFKIEKLEKERIEIEKVNFEAEEIIKKADSYIELKSKEIFDLLKNKDEYSEVISKKEYASQNYKIYITNITKSLEKEKISLSIKTILKKIEDIELKLKILNNELENTKKYFSEEKLAETSKFLKEIREENENLSKDISYLESEKKHLKERIEKNNKENEIIIKKEKENEVLQKKIELTDMFRKNIGSMGRAVSSGLIYIIEKKSTENFRRITGRDEEINWTNGEKETYSVYLKSKDGNKRLFEILSGGEQVAVGLSIRAAMASTLTNAGFTIFDEPTINLDVERRRYLSESLQEVLKGLEQAIIVTHDDTFEEMAERIIEV